MNKIDYWLFKTSHLYSQPISITLKSVFYKLLIFLIAFALLLAGYSANNQGLAKKSKKAATENCASQQEETIVESVSFEATTSIFQNSIHRFSIILFSFEFNLAHGIVAQYFFPEFPNTFKTILFSRISRANAP
ncbi:MAG: hypothetical protein ACKVOU_07340 [Cytophagales bacterium]